MQLAIYGFRETSVSLLLADSGH